MHYNSSRRPWIRLAIDQRINWGQAFDNLFGCLGMMLFGVATIFFLFMALNVGSCAVNAIKLEKAKVDWQLRDLNRASGGK